MATGIESDQLVVLRGGPAVRLATIAWLIDAEFRGVKVCVEADGRLFAGPRARVTSDDLVFIRAHRDELIEAVRYVEQAAEWPL